MELVWLVGFKIIGILPMGYYTCKQFRRDFFLKVQDHGKNSYFMSTTIKKYTYPPGVQGKIFCFSATRTIDMYITNSCACNSYRIQFNSRKIPHDITSDFYFFLFQRLKIF
jgi:hypothetical protein